MTSRPAPSEQAANRVHLAALRAGSEPLERHPNDGWRLADPYPLGPHALVALRGVIDALCPAGKAPRSPEIMRKVELGTQRMLRYMHPAVARGLWFGLFLLDWLPVLTLKSRGRLHHLRPERASAFVARWARSRVKALRLLVTGVRSLVLSVYFDQSEVHEALRYRPVPFLRERIAFRRALLSPARAAAE
jgi:hypothetical protein